MLLCARPMALACPAPEWTPATTPYLGTTPMSLNVTKGLISGKKNILGK